MTIKIGIQLYSVRESLARDPEGTLSALVDLGFTRFEGANHEALTEDGIGFGIRSEFLAEFLAARNASIIGCHIGPLDIDRLPAVLDYQKKIGNPRIGLDIDFFPYNDIDYVKRRADQFNEIGRLCSERGIQFYYHNHFQEFQRFGDTTVYEILMERTDPGLVSFELDTYWAYRGGADPVELFRAYPDRFILIHQKDFPKDFHEPLNLFDGIIERDAQITMDLFTDVVDPRAFAAVGTGILPIQEIIDAANNLPNFEYLLLEQDYALGNELDSIKVSRDAFTRYKNIEQVITSMP